MSYSYALRIGNGGWVRWELAGHEMSGYVRFENDGERLSIRELYMPQVPTARELYRVPIAPLEARANNRGDVVGDLIRSSIGQPSPLLATAISYFDATPRGADGWVGDMLKSQHPSFGVPQVPAKRVKSVIPAPNSDVDAKLEIPSTRRFPNEFYERVAGAYMDLSARFPNPNGRIADANEVSVKRVEQWVIRARKLGFLPPARQGKRG